MGRDAVLERARRCLGQKAKYGLGAGGFQPDAQWPWNSEGQLDCSGFLAWCLGTSRYLHHPWYRNVNGGWLETSAIVRDCGTRFGLFDRVPWSQARTADLLVYGDSGEHQGHVGIISEVDAAAEGAEAAPSKVIHCSAGNFREGGDAIAETGVELWEKRGGIVARYAVLA